MKLFICILFVLFTISAGQYDSVLDDYSDELQDNYDEHIEDQFETEIAKLAHQSLPPIENENDNVNTTILNDSLKKTNSDEIIEELVTNSSVDKENNVTDKQSDSIKEKTGEEINNANRLINYLPLNENETDDSLNNPVTTVVPLSKLMNPFISVKFEFDATRSTTPVIYEDKSTILMHEHFEKIPKESGKNLDVIRVFDDSASSISTILSSASTTITPSSSITTSPSTTISSSTSPTTPLTGTSPSSSPSSITTTTSPSTTSPSTPTTTSSTTTSTTISSTLPPAINLDDKTPFYSMTVQSNEPSNVEIRAAYGYSIKVTVEQLKFDSIESYLIIKGGEGIDDNDSRGAYFARYLTKKRILLFPDGVVFVKYVPISATETDKAVIRFELEGEAITTSTTLSTPTPAPTPSVRPDDDIFAVVNVTGHSLTMFENDDVLQLFKTCVVDMAKKYCTKEGIILTEELTETSVLLRSIKSCPYGWPHAETCVQIKFLFPIFQEHSYSVYMLNQEQLEKMWEQYASDSNCLNQNRFIVYDIPSYRNAITWWALAITAIILVFIALLWILNQISQKLNYKKFYYVDEEDEFVNVKRPSKVSLPPNYWQP